MHLALPLPAGWSLEERAGQRRAVLADAGGSSGIWLAWGPLILLPDDQQRWMRQAMHREVAEGCSLALGVPEEGTTGRGWPLALLPAEVLSPDGQVRERRLGAFYAFFEHGAAVLVRSSAPARFAACRDELVELLRRGAPDWSGQVAAISDLFDLEPGAAGLARLNRARSA